MPSFALRGTIGSIASRLASKNLLVLTKGIETGTFLGMSGVIAELIGESTDRIAVLSGPSFAKEVANGSFTASVIASQNKHLAQYFQQMVHSDSFRIYVSDDVVGVELGGALKNVMAIGAGIIEGLKLGTNTQAAYCNEGPCRNEKTREGPRCQGDNLYGPLRDGRPHPHFIWKSEQKSLIRYGTCERKKCPGYNQ